MNSEVLVGAYRLISRLGSGGMGDVWLAEHAMLGRRAAIKMLQSSVSNRADIVQRFFNEARAATLIDDPGIVQVFDFGHANDGRAYIVMELLDGEPLDRRLFRRGSLDVRDAVRIMRQVASSVGAAHERGIIHRDLKPENLFLARDPEVPGGERAKILDFGIAKLSTTPARSQTLSSAVIGTPTYMSPEQVRGAGHVDVRSDVYALGCVTFALITGRPPFDSDGPGEIMAMHLRETAPRMSSRATGVPADLDELVARCLAKDPAHRPADGRALAAELEQVLARMTPTPPPASGEWRDVAAAVAAAKPTTVLRSVGPRSSAGTNGTPGAPLAHGMPSSDGSRSHAPIAKRPRARWVAAAACIAASGAVGAWFALGPTRRAEAAAEPRAIASAPAPVPPRAEAPAPALVPVAALPPALPPVHVAEAAPEPPVADAPAKEPVASKPKRDAIVKPAKPATTPAAATASEPAAPAPAPDAEPAPAATAETRLDRAMISASVGRVRGLINKCADLDPDTHGRVIVNAKVDATGRIVELQTLQSPSDLLTACVESRLRLATFPATTLGGSFRWPFAFEARD